ncbi:hypothetical protein [Actinoplanes sp. DH11]|uniref:hypothetical protein n=1 Tax=Actinoplanes sp. DH11 TaxID=2857011 RepID=UPI001E316C1D|nr:hypothetical protein [Actinoplanes sp. DH11]
MRVFRTILGMLLLTVGLPALLAGGALWALMQHRDPGGAFSGELQKLAIPGYAVVVPDIDRLLRDDAPFARIGDTRLRLAAATTDGAAFVGLAPAADVSRYLAGVPHTRVDAVDIGTGALPVTTERVLGPRVPAGIPGQQAFWTRTGNGQLNLVPGELTGGPYSLVLMSPGGAPVNRLAAVAEVRPSWLNSSTWGLITLGTLLIMASVVVLAWPGRRREVVYVVEPSQVPELMYAIGAPLPNIRGSRPGGAHRPRTLADSRPARPPALPEFSWPPKAPKPQLPAGSGAAPSRTSAPLALPDTPTPAPGRPLNLLGETPALSAMQPGPIPARRTNRRTAAPGDIPEFHATAVGAWVAATAPERARQTEARAAARLREAAARKASSAVRADAPIASPRKASATESEADVAPEAVLPEAGLPEAVLTEAVLSEAPGTLLTEGSDAASSGSAPVSGSTAASGSAPASRSAAAPGSAPDSGSAAASGSAPDLGVSAGADSSSTGQSWNERPGNLAEAPRQGGGNIRPGISRKQARKAADQRRTASQTTKPAATPPAAPAGKPTTAPAAGSASEPTPSSPAAPAGVSASPSLAVSGIALHTGPAATDWNATGLTHMGPYRISPTDAPPAPEQAARTDAPSALQQTARTDAPSAPEQTARTDAPSAPEQGASDVHPASIVDLAPDAAPAATAKTEPTPVDDQAERAAKPTQTEKNQQKSEEDEADSPKRPILPIPSRSAPAPDATEEKAPGPDHPAVDQSEQAPAASSGQVVRNPSGPAVDGPALGGPALGGLLGQAVVDPSGQSEEGRHAQAAVDPPGQSEEGRHAQAAVDPPAAVTDGSTTEKTAGTKAPGSGGVRALPETRSSIHTVESGRPPAGKPMPKDTAVAGASAVEGLGGQGSTDKAAEPGAPRPAEAEPKSAEPEDAEPATAAPREDDNVAAGDGSAAAADRASMHAVEASGFGEARANAVPAQPEPAGPVRKKPANNPLTRAQSRLAGKPSASAGKSGTSRRVPAAWLKAAESVAARAAGKTGKVPAPEQPADHTPTQPGSEAAAQPGSDAPAQAKPQAPKQAEPQEPGQPKSQGSEQAATQASNRPRAQAPGQSKARASKTVPNAKQPGQVPEQPEAQATGQSHPQAPEQSKAQAPAQPKPQPRPKPPASEKQQKVSRTLSYREEAAELLAASSERRRRRTVAGRPAADRDRDNDVPKRDDPKDADRPNG